MTDEELQLAAALSGVPLQQSILAQRMQRAQGLIGTPAAQGQQVGRVYRAASPLEHAATALARAMGYRQAGQVEKDLGALAQQAQQGGLAQMRIERGDKDRAFGLQQAGLERQIAADVASREHQAATLGLSREQLARQQAADAAEQARYAASQAETARHNKASELLTRSAQTQDAWSAIADPVTGGIVLYNKRTRESVPLGPGGGAPGPGKPGPLPGLPGKPTETQRNKVLGASENIAQLDQAIEALKKAPGAYGGLGNFTAGLVESAGGTPAQSIMARRYSPEELRAKNQISNVVSKIINERAGANVTLREELRQKFLPQDTDSYENASQKLGDLRTMMGTTYKAQGGDLVPDPGTAPVRKTINGKTYEQQGGKWFEVD